MPRKITDPRRAALFLAEIWENARLVWRLLLDHRVPLATKSIIPATLLYILSPVDLVPDIIPGLGQLDDLAILLIGLKLFIEMSPKHLVRQIQDELNFRHRANQDTRRADEQSSATIDGVYRVVDDGPNGAK